MARHKKRTTNNTAADLRPIAKKLLQQALRVYDAAKDTFVEAGEQFEDLVNEARAEMNAGKPPKAAKGRKRGRER
jgi:hypothetical protein